MEKTIHMMSDVTAGPAPVSASSENCDLSLRLIAKAGEFVALADEWDRLAEADPAATIFQSHTWLSLWWKHFSRKTDRLAILLCYSNGTLVGAAPFFLRTIRFAGWPVQRQLRLLGSGEVFSNTFGIFLDDGPSDYLNILAIPAYESKVTRAIERAIVNGTVSCDRLELLNIPDGSPLRHLFQHETSGVLFARAVTGADVCPYLPTPSSKEEYLRSISPNIRRKFSQLSRALTNEQFFRLRAASTRAEAIEVLEYLITLHQHRWNRLGYPGLFAKPHFGDFFRDLCGRLFDRGELWCKVVENDNSIFGARIAFSFNSGYFDYLSGFDDQSPMTKHRPGFALLADMLDDAILAKTREINFLRGDESYKFELTSAVRKNVNIVLTSIRYRGTVRYYFWQISGITRFCVTLLRREWNLLQVQYTRHPLHLFLLRYIEFRLPKFTAKFSSLRKHTGKQDSETIEPS